MYNSVSAIFLVDFFAQAQRWRYKHLDASSMAGQLASKIKASSVCSSAYLSRKCKSYPQLSACTPCPHCVRSGIQAEWENRGIGAEEKQSCRQRARVLL
jgi:hypothetical protein